MRRAFPVLLILSVFLASGCAGRFRSIPVPAPPVPEGITGARPGDYVRITTTSGVTHTGWIASITPETWEIREQGDWSGGDPVIAVPVRGIRSVDIRHPSRFGSGVVLGIGIGLIAFAAVVVHGLSGTFSTQ
ncbi:hypothetical protein K8I85_17505 [bacterium]|nr:hypothetical protein [bacterium]